MKYQVENKTGFTKITFEGEMFHASELASYLQAAPQIGVDIPAGDGVILSGRGPIWLYAALTHIYHPAAWVATFDPRLGGAVVVERHTPNSPALGEIVQ